MEVDDQHSSVLDAAPSATLVASSSSSSSSAAPTSSPGASGGFGGGNDYVEQFKILARTTSGRATAAILDKVMNHKHIFVFAEILELDRVQELRGSPLEGNLRALEIMAHGEFADYEAEQASLPPFSDVQKRKLRMLTLVSLASRCKTLKYDVVRAALRMKSDREVEDVFIESMYAGLLKARLYHRERQGIVQWVMARDLKDEDLASIASRLGKWCDNANDLMDTLKKAIKEVHSTREEDTVEHALLAQTVKQQVRQSAPAR